MRKASKSRKKTNFSPRGLRIYLDWLKKAAKAAEHQRGMVYQECFQVDSPGDYARYEILVTNIHERLLDPLLGNGTLPFLSPKDKLLFAKIEKEEPFPLLEKRFNHGNHSACAAVGASLRTSLVSNARVSSYGFCIPAVQKVIPNINYYDLLNYGGQFFTELIDLYFSVFGRGNTLNEYFLDKVLEHYHDRLALCVRYEPKIESKTASNPFRLNLGRRGRYMVLTVSSEIANDLTGRWKWADEFWRLSWQTFQELVIFAVKNVPSDTIQSLQKDWVPVAVQRMWSNSGGESLTLALREARLKTEKHIYRSQGNTFKHLEQLYPEKSTSIGQKLEQFLIMLQGSLCLIPWARDTNGNPLPVITIPVLKDDYKCAWTVIPSEQVTSPSNWGKCQEVAEKLFSKAIEPYQPLKKSSQEKNNQDKTLKEDWGKQLSERKNEARTEEHNEKSTSGLLEAKVITKVVDELYPLGKKFLNLVKAAKHLTGIGHEGHGISYCFIYGPAEVLKHVQRVMSNERPTGRQYDELPEDDDKQINYFKLRCEGHYALYQQEGVGGFVDQVHGPLYVDKVVILNTPADADLAQMRNDDILDDRYRAVRWLTWIFRDAKNKVAVLVAGSDGVLRLFLNGRLFLVWRRLSDPDTNHWTLGIEYELDEGSPADKLRKKIMEAFGVDSSTASVRDLVTTICEISDTPGEGAIFVIGGKTGEFPVLYDMVPDEFKMEWACVRQLSGLEQGMLHSLAVMDGAVHIAVHGPEEAWVCARRYIVAGPDIQANQDTSEKTSRLLSCDLVIKKYFKPWIKDLTECKQKGEEEKRALDYLVKWQQEIGTKGTRHHSVIQLCLWMLGHVTTDEKWPLVCSISADGDVNLYQIKKCKCGKPYLWTNKLIS